ncbi:MAG: MogA/MoaB family molybdenum cofactor biosynthesis protein [PVC group bacterium]
MTGKNKYTAAVLTVSTSCAKGEREDASGPTVQAICREIGIEVIATGLVPDDSEAIREKLLFFCNERRANLVLTTGGTGPGPSDITPEETGFLCDRLIPGIPELMRAEGGKKTLRAYLSRGVAGIRGRSLIINLPGSPGAVRESMGAISGILLHALDMIAGEGHD